MPRLSLSIYASLLLTVACFTKSAQVPFNRWLPLAIAAPTPVSALVHSSTLVTAGVYVLIRVYPSLEHYSVVCNFIRVIGAVTLILGGLLGIKELDLKKVVAYSTLSQLGYIICILGLGHPFLCFIHLITHAIFKASLFIAIGEEFIINFHYQRKGALSRYRRPVLWRGLIIALASINIVPFLGGIYSKEAILNLRIRFVFRGLNVEALFLVLTLWGGSVLTAFYSTLIFKGVNINSLRQPPTFYIRGLLRCLIPSYIIL